MAEGSQRRGGRARRLAQGPHSEPGEDWDVLISTHGAQRGVVWLFHFQDPNDTTQDTSLPPAVSFSYSSPDNSCHLLSRLREVP